MRTPKFIAAAAAASLLAIPAAASADGHGAMVTVVHGIPDGALGIEDTTVDVFVNGEEAIPDFTFGTVTDPIMLPAGDYEIDVYPNDTGPDGDPLLEFDGPLADGTNVSLVAHLTSDASGAALTPFPNDVSAVTTEDATARATVVHAAAAPAVSILAGGNEVIPEIATGESGSVEVPAGSYDIDIAADGEVVLEVGDTEFPEGMNTIIFAVGEFPDSFELLPTMLSLEATDAGGAGEAGLSTDSSALALTAAGLMVLAGMALGLRRRATDTV